LDLRVQQLIILSESLLVIDYLQFGLLLFSMLVYANDGTSGAASFTGIGSLDGVGGGFRSIAYDVSADGSVVVGEAASNSGRAAFRWTSIDGMAGLGYLPGGNSFSRANAVSADGSVIVGDARSSSRFEAFRWNSMDGMVGLGHLFVGNTASLARAVSSDGSIIVGQGLTGQGGGAFRWTHVDGISGIGDPSGENFLSTARDVSADGSVVVGTSGNEAFHWTDAGGWTGLGELPGGLFNSHAFAVSADGSTVVGADQISGLSFEGFRWTSTEGMVGLGDLPGGAFNSAPRDVSGNGNIVVGHSETALGQRAFIWDDVRGMRELKDVLVNDYGLGPSLIGWDLIHANGISEDGKTIVGSGINPSGNNEAWIARIPEPCTLVLIGLGISGLFGCQRQSRP
jgi:probable HAF family extracellular repeat protein